MPKPVLAPPRTQRNRLAASEPKHGLRISGNLRPERQTLKAVFLEDDVRWAAGLFAGEGNVGLVEQRNANDSRIRRYPSLQLKMLDGRAVEAFADAFGLRFLMSKYKGVRCLYRVNATGGVARPVLEAMYPHLIGTEKASQIERVFDLSGTSLRRIHPADQGQNAGGATPAVTSGRRRSRDWLLDRRKFNADDVNWASGLFAAEGYVAIQVRRKGAKSYSYPALSISMLDEGAILRFARTFFFRSFSFERKDLTRAVNRVHSNGSAAEAALRAMYRFLFATDKGSQIKGVFSKLRLELNADGSGNTWKRTNGWVGRSLSPEHRAALFAGRDRYWEGQKSVG